MLNVFFFRPSREARAVFWTVTRTLAIARDVVREAPGQTHLNRLCALAIQGMRSGTNAGYTPR